MHNSLPSNKFDVIEFPGGTFLRATQKQFPALRGLAIQALKLKPGAVREPHSHPNAEQLDYCVSGEARVGIVRPEGHKQLLPLKAGDISFDPRGYVHWIENAGSGPLHFLVVLSHEQPETIELSETIHGVPADTLASTFDLPKNVLEQLPNKTVTIGGGTKM